MSIEGTSGEGGSGVVGEIIRHLDPFGEFTPPRDFYTHEVLDGESNPVVLYETEADYNRVLLISIICKSVILVPEVSYVHEDGSVNAAVFFEKISTNHPEINTEGIRANFLTPSGHINLTPLKTVAHATLTDERKLPDTLVGRSIRYMTFPALERRLQAGLIQYNASPLEDFEVRSIQVRLSIQRPRESSTPPARPIPTASPPIHLTTVLPDATPGSMPMRPRPRLHYALPAAAGAGGSGYSEESAPPSEDRVIERVIIEFGNSTSNGSGGSGSSSSGEKGRMPTARRERSGIIRQLSFPSLVEHEEKVRRSSFPTTEEEEETRSSEDESKRGMRHRSSNTLLVGEGEIARESPFSATGEPDEETGLLQERDAESPLEEEQGFVRNCVTRIKEQIIGCLRYFFPNL